MAQARQVHSKAGGRTQLATKSLANAVADQAATMRAFAGSMITKELPSRVVQGGVGNIAKADTGIAVILGSSTWRNKAEFLKRLVSVYPARPVGGRVTYNYRAVGAPLFTGGMPGELPGALVLSHQQAQSLAETIDSLLDGLEPVVGDPNHEYIDRLKAEIRSLTQDIVEEFGREGGPVVARIERLVAVLKADKGPYKELGTALGVAGTNDCDRKDLGLLKLDFLSTSYELLRKKIGAFETLEPGGGGSSNCVNRIRLVERIAADVARIRANCDDIGLDPNDWLVKANDRETISAEGFLHWCTAAAANWRERLRDGGHEGDLIAISTELDGNNDPRGLKAIVKTFLDKIDDSGRITIRTVSSTDVTMDGGALVKEALKELSQHFEAIEGTLTANNDSPE